MEWDKDVHSLYSLQSSAKATWQDKEIKTIQIRKENVKLFLSLTYLILHLKYPEAFTRKMRPNK